jgi:hypothetical protein
MQYLRIKFAIHDTSFSHDAPIAVKRLSNRRRLGVQALEWYVLRGQLNCQRHEMRWVGNIPVFGYIGT